jgi:uncharacterized protein (TIGR00369 family)
VEREELEDIIRRTPFACLLDARLEDFAPGKVSLSAPLAPQLKMHLDFAHGAVIGFMADSACAWAAASVSADVVTAEYKLNLLSPATGERLFASGEVLKASGRVVACRADVFAQTASQSTLVATALATIVRVR